MPVWKTEMQEIKIGTGRRLREGEEIAILTIGHPGNFAATAIRELRTYGLNPGHYDLRFVKPLDEALLHEIMQRYPRILTVEDGTVLGGFGSAVLEFMARNNYRNQIQLLGIPDVIVEHGSLKELHQECHYDSTAIAACVREIMKDSIRVSLHQ
jgi:1-deoxy-D-xylulose-5-phosphate synthase